MSTVFIYALVDPRDDRVRYVGKSIKPKKRCQGHITEARRGLKTHRHNWIRKLLRNGLKPNLLILEEITEDEWELAEKKWIAHFRQENGDDLTNTADGGNAPPPYQHNEKSRKKIGDFFRGKPISEEHKRKISEGKLRAPHPYRGKPLSAEHKRKLSESMTGHSFSPEFGEQIRKRMLKNNPMKGHDFSEEHRRKLGEAHRGLKHTEGTKEKMSKSAHKRNQDPEYRKKLSEAAKRRWAENREEMLRITQQGMKAKRAREAREKVENGKGN